ncbi:DNA-binding response regulator [Flavobacterium magnum]|uniref:DNA-binding response regulator n=1 Tax=Flavobacterium magnum TaxID=2162713 RepID=A0A2S0RFM2_9FLAO|nr:response regulator transcription factor [Flavobacterium magnum]AWA29512.1 DNA-binding response regulator [Flavobacterium magnum]
MNILIVEDHAELAQELTDYLSRLGYVTKHVNSCAAARDEVAVTDYDVMLLDLGLPDGDGLDALRDVRKTASKMAVIILTARGALDDRVRGLQLGADDYLTKPFALPELGARLSAIVRRMHGFAANEVRLHGFTVQLEDFKVSYDGIGVALTKKEFQIFRYLILNKNRVITRLQLTEHIWGDVLEINSDSNFIDVHVRNLRNKLDRHTAIDWFETVRNVGYRINE